MHSLRPLFLLFLSLGLGFPGLLQATSYQVDSSKSRVEVLVLRAGLLGFLGHDHEIVSRKLSGTVRYTPPSVSSLEADITIPALSLTVVDPQVPLKERREVQSIMQGERVLDVARYPEIHFTSTGAVPGRTAGQALVSGSLSLHGAVKKIRFPVRFSATGGELRATGTAQVRQTDFGIEPIRIAGGTVRVKDLVEIHFSLVAHQGPEDGR
ncbi:YceI family protein [Methylacidimicrobium cyclopophantes]|uniref:YceI family protein n=1 Tax=Methylacidimicrobium cyclopophantes TaxID=1041766 RepID=UPI0015B454A6|nr:YceI family protein [Methylacidimicrobium cyclopophantes]